MLSITFILPHPLTPSPSKERGKYIRRGAVAPLRHPDSAGITPFFIETASMSLVLPLSQKEMSSGE
jgi:hypothetical protein